MNRKLIIALGIFIICAIVIALVIPFFKLQQLNQSRWERKTAFVNAYRILTHHGNPPDGRLPDIVGKGEQGQQLCSWRLRLLQFSVGLGEAPIPEEPWNSPHNLQFTVIGSRLFCREGETETYVLAVTGVKTAFPPGGEVEFASIDNDTIVLIEVANSGFNWAVPGDFTVYQGKNVEEVRFSHIPGSANDDCFLVVFADGTAWFLRDDIPKSILAKFLDVELARTVDRSVDLVRFRID